MTPRPILSSLVLMGVAIVLQTTLFARLEQFAIIPDAPLLIVILAARWLDPDPALLLGFTGGIVLVKDKVSSPRMRPVAWRETDRRSLGTFRYLFRVLVALELPVIVIVVFQDWNQSVTGLGGMLIVTGSRKVTVYGKSFIRGSKPGRSPVVAFT